jgi:heme/copper-type cytochrome/quinol oxidase subunit 2
MRNLLRPVPLSFILAALLVIIFPLPAFAAPAEKTFRVEARDFAFTPPVIQVNPGDRVTIELVAKDVTHGLTIDGYPVDLRSEPGQTARATFIAGRAGVFRLRCSVACGNLHPFMTGKFMVGPNLAWLRAAGLALLAFVFSLSRRKRG